MIIQSVGYESEAERNKAEILANQLQLQLDKDANPCLFVSSERMYLKCHKFSPLYADFSSATWNKRKSEGKKQGLVRACKPKLGIKIIDATAGWGRDAAILASFGAEVLMLERNPLMAALLQDALALRNDQDKTQMNILLSENDAISYFNTLNELDFPDVIYIDPMHPERTKSALVKKEMQALQSMIGEDIDAMLLIQSALGKVKQRVVVKWPQREKPLLRPDSSVEGKTVRFDVYLSRLGSKTV